MEHSHTLGLISIIIPAYNATKYIETTLSNLFAQTYQNFEIIIAYDEKSTDTPSLSSKRYRKHIP